MNIVFLGNGEFSCNVFKKIMQSSHKIVACVCSADKITGRGKQMKSAPLVLLAKESDIPVFQFKSIKKEGVIQLKDLNADIMVTAAFGQMLSLEVINLFRYGTINVHGSLLPKYRGASPIQQAIINGDDTTGVSIMNTELSMDTGDVFCSAEVKIDSDDTFVTLAEKMAEVGGDILIKTLCDFENNSVTKTKQDDSKATYTKLIKNDDCKIDFGKSAQDVVNFVRALNPNPLAYFTYKNERFLVLKARTAICQSNEKGFGQVVVSSNKKGLFVKCNIGYVEIEEFKPQGKNVMSPKSYLNGKKIFEGDFLNE